MRLTTRLYEKKIRTIFPFFRTIDIRRILNLMNEENLDIFDYEVVINYIENIIKVSEYKPTYNRGKLYMINSVFPNNKVIINKKFYVYILGLHIDEQDT